MNGATIEVFGKKYTEAYRFDMTRFPGLSKFWQAIVMLKGVRGAYYTLDVDHNNGWILNDSKQRTIDKGRGGEFLMTWINKLPVWSD